MITLTQKKVKARLFYKTNVRNKESLNKLKFNDDSPDEKILCNNSGSEVSGTLFIDTKVSKKRKRGKKENQDIQREDIFEKAKDVTFISEVHVPLTFHITRVFLTRYWIFSSLEDTRR